MGNELVTGSDSQAATGGGNRRLPVVYRYGETFEKLCGYYMSLGMGYHDYWDGDCEMARYYRDMDEKVKERQNEALWLQGLYFYEALVDASPVLNAMSKKHKPILYRQAPIPLTEARHRQQQEEENHKKLNAGKEAMKQIMAGVNSKFKRKEE